MSLWVLIPAAIGLVVFWAVMAGVIAWALSGLIIAIHDRITHPYETGWRSWDSEGNEITAEDRE